VLTLRLPASPPVKRRVWVLHGIWFSMLAVMFCFLAEEQTRAELPPADADRRASSASAASDRSAKTPPGGTERAAPRVSAPDRGNAAARKTLERIGEFLQNTTRASGTDVSKRTEGPEPARGAADQQAENGAKRPAIEEVKPEVLYLRDKSGRLVPVPGFTYEDFIELVELQQRRAGPGNAAPEYSLQQLIISGDVRELRADLTIRIDVRVRSDGWVRVPLGLGKTALVGAAEYEGKGNHFLHYDETTTQYVAWLRGAAGAEHRLQIRVHVALTSTVEQRKLELAVPRAATSRLTLKVPQAPIVASATPAGLTPEVVNNGPSSEIRLLGVAGDLSLSWSERPPATARAESMLETSGTVIVNIDGRSVSTDAMLSVRSFGEEFDRFRVRLPKGAVLAGGQQVGYTLTSVGANASGLVEVKLDKPTAGPFEVKLHTERTFDLARPGEALELAGFEVLEAAPHRQGGQIGVIVSGDWQVIWENRARVRQIDEPVQSLQQRDLLAAFEYVGQPCSLTAQVVPRRTRIVVDPEYVFYVEAHQTRLEARLKYSIRGAKVFALSLDLPGWEIDQIGPPTLVDFESVTTDVDSQLRIPLLQPTVGDIEITLGARREHVRDANGLELQLPLISDAVIGPANVAVVPEDNIELTTRSAELVGLSPQRAPGLVYLPPRRQEPLVFRAEGSSAKYVADLKVHQQKIAVQVANLATVSRAQVDVEQRFAYQVFYEPVTRLHFAVPQQLAVPNGLEMFVDGEPVAPELIAEEGDGADNLRMQLTLNEPQIGLVEVVCRFRMPIDELYGATTLPFDIPLPMPLEGEFSGNTLTIECEAGCRTELRDDLWKILDEKAPGTGRTLRLAAAAAAPSAAVTMMFEDRPATGGAVIERGWVQTWLTDQTRQERAVFQFKANQPRLSITLPAGVSTEELEVLMDSQPILPTLQDNVVVVECPMDSELHVAELRYGYREAGRNGMLVAFDMPGFESGVRVRRVYWQLILPRDKHLLSANANLTPEFNWVREGLLWSRANVLDQFDLEEWSQTRQESPLPDSLNVYLFSTMGEDQVFEVWVARRSTIVFAASLVALLIMLFALYTRWLRRPRPLIVVGIVVIALALAYPDPAVLLGQAAMLGVVLALAAALLHRVLHREAAREEARPVPSSLTIERTSTDVYYRPAGTSSASSSPKSMALERSTSESHVQ
jgi:hypothetical protein